MAVQLAHMKELGLRLKTKKTVLSPLQRTTYLGVVWDLTTMQTRLSPARIESILTAVTRVKEGRSLTLGSGHEWPPCPWSVEWLPSHVAHQLPGDAGCVSGKHFLLDLTDCHVLVRTDNTVVVYYINHQGGQTPLAESSSCSWASEHGSRHPVEAGAEARGMGSPGTGCHGTDVAEASSVRLSPDRSAPGSSGESASGRGPSSFSSPVLVGPSMVLGPDFPSRRLSMGDSRQEESPLSGRRHHPPPSPGVVEVMGVAPEGAHLVASSLSTEVVQTILQSRAPSTRKLYALKWKLFTSWCGQRQQEPVNCPVGTVLEYLQDRFSSGLAHSTLRVYVAAISAYHAPLGGMSVGKDPLVVCFLCGALRLRPPVWPRVPTWDLAVVLEALCRPPFEPIKESLDHHLSAKTALGYPGYVPKVPSAAPRPVAYEFLDLPSPLGVKAHSTRGISASKAFMSGVPVQDICDAAGWSTPLIFVRFYDLDLRVAPDSSVLRPSTH
ncbi:Ubiquitin carboxyl-terminal hydrolase 36 [Labeo rohita]|uniref:Ubiquitin carboxyl-terminal hydrolase 36 n=1 Tax=Labeo rohita TaxID=84645 RepID=A0ABQ8M2K0_LABRO|nr:Ubiquitin carboxyl-terminal hydrolase 36 [Labeo rohita]